MNKELIVHLVESSNHYDRMIEWAKTQPKKHRPSFQIMKQCIREDWSGSCCSLCKNYMKKIEKEHSHSILDCSNCILYQKGFGCNEGRSLWRIILSSQTWKEWIIHAKQMRKALLKIIEEVIYEDINNC